MNDTLDGSNHTSAQRRIPERENPSNSAKSAKLLLNPPLKPVTGLDASGLLDLTELSYIELVQWAGE